MQTASLERRHSCRRMISSYDAQSVFFSWEAGMPPLLPLGFILESTDIAPILLRNYKLTKIPLYFQFYRFGMK